MTDTPADKPKIIVDEDWKSQVQKEKEALQQQQGTTPESESATGEATQHGEPQYPPATFPVLLSTLAAQAMVGLGQIAHPVTNKPEVDLAGARHFIDTLEMLEQKTAGNRTPEENAMLEQILHQLRMAYVSMSR